MLCFNEDMHARTVAKFNLSLPATLMEQFASTVEKYGGRRKGDAIAAAVVLFLQLGADAQDRLVGDVAKAKVTGDFEALLKPAAPLDDIMINLPATQEIRRRRKKA